MPQIVWYKDNQVLTEEDFVQIETQENSEDLESYSRLFIGDVVPHDHKGKYTVEAVNPFGTVRHDVPVTGSKYVHNIMFCFYM